MTVFPYTIPSPPTLWATNQLLSANQSIITWIGADGSRWPLSGGLAPMIAAQDGVNLLSIKGLMGSWKHLDQTSAHQDGVDWLDAVWDPTEVDMVVAIAGQTPSGYRKQQRGWMDSWDPKLTGKLVWFSQELGEWWLTMRMLKETDAELTTGPAFMTSQQFPWAARADQPFWTSFDSCSSLVANSSTNMVDPAGRNPNNFLPLWNRGDQAAWPRYLFKGPGTIQIADANSNAHVTFGPLPAGQTVLITTEIRKRSIRELTTKQNYYPLLNGRFSTPVPAGAAPKIKVSVTGATSAKTQINAFLTPLRKWPE